MQKGPNPTWGINSETFTIRKVISPHMALLRLAVYEENSNKVIYFTQILERFLQDKSLSDKSWIQRGLHFTSISFASSGIYDIISNRTLLNIT